MSGEKLLPIGYEASAKDWNAAFAGRDMTINDWNSLTLGEQQRYAMAECQTKGAIYSSKISSHEITFSVSLPKSLRMIGITSEQAQNLERYLHRKMEEQITAIVQMQRMMEQESDNGR